MGSQSGIGKLAKGRGEYYQLAVADVHIKPDWNSRDFSTPENIEHVDTLAKSIMEIGQKTPIKVIYEDGKAFITDGESRYRAIKIAIERGADIKIVKAILEDKYSNEADHLFTQIVGNSGKPFTPLETAHVYKRLIDYGWKEKEIAKKAGKTTVHVVESLKLLSAPAAITDLVKSGQVSATMAQQTIRAAKGDHQAATKTLAKAVKVAKKAGKKKATARDAKAPAGLTFKAELKAIFGRADYDGTAVILTVADYGRLAALDLVPTWSAPQAYTEPSKAPVPFPPAAPVT